MRGLLLGRTLALLLGGLLALGAQGPGDPFRTGLPAMQVYGEREGLPHATIHALAIDTRGLLWVGTPDGAASFNGRAWVPLQFPPECRSKYVRALAFPPDGSAWFGTQDDGLWQWHQGRWTHHDHALGLPARRINHLFWEAVGPGYVVWASTADAGIARYLDGAWRVWGVPEGLKKPWVWRMRRGRDRLWIAGMGGLAALSGERIESFPLRSEALGQEVNDVLDFRNAEGDGDVYVTCWDRGLGHWRNGAWRLIGPEAGFPSHHPVVLAHTKGTDGIPTIWVGTYDHGLLRRKGEGPWESLNHARGFPGAGVYDLLSDPRRQPTLWVAMRGAGVGALDAGGWVRLDARQGLPPDRVMGMARTASAHGTTYWFGTEGGLLRWENGRWSHQGTTTGFPSTIANAVLLSHAFGPPKLAVGTLKGLVLQEGSGWLLQPGLGPFRTLQVAALHERIEEGAPALWVGMEGGLARHHKGRWTGFTSHDGLPHDWVYAITSSQDAAGRDSLWIGTRGGGVARYQGGVWTRYGAERGLPNPSVYALLLEPLPGGRKRLWAGMYGGGLAWLDPDDPAARWSALTSTSNPALPSDAVVALERDPLGRLYAMTTRGVARLEGPPGSNPGPTWRIRTYSEGNGLPSRLCNQASSMMDDRGRLWVGTAAGLAALDPSEEIPPAPLGTPVLERATASGVSLAPASTYAFTHAQKNLVFEYCLPVFIRADDLRYQTQLLGLEDRPTPWVPEGRRELTGLGPGRYTLRIRARDHLGRETEPLDLPIRVLAAPWKSAPAYALYGLAIAGLMGLIHRVRTRLLEARNRELQVRVHAATESLERQKASLEAANQRLVNLDETKSRMLGVVAHDLRNPLNAIMLNAEFLSEPDMEAKEVLEVSSKIRQCADFMQELLRRFLDLEAIEGGRLDMNLQPVLPNPLIERALDSYRARAMAKGIHLGALAPPGLPPVVADQVFLQEVLDNLISNALKFTPKGPPVRNVTVAAGLGWISVGDEGPGFSPEDKQKAFGQFARLSARPTGGESSTGLGLAIVKSLVETMGGRIELESELGVGTTFTLHFPVAGTEGAEGLRD